MDEYNVKLMLTTEILGTVPDKDIYKAHIGNDLPEEQLEGELETVPENLDKGWTGFHMVDGTPFLYDYVIKGFFKDACGMLRRCAGTKSSKLTAYKKVVDGVVFIAPRKILLNLNGSEMGTNERPIRIDTPRGPRVALAHSHTCPPGTTLEFKVSILGVVDESLLTEWLYYGELRGLGQWRNGGWGSFTYTLEELS